MRPIYKKFSGDDAPFDLAQKGSDLHDFMVIAQGKGMDISRKGSDGSFVSHATQNAYEIFLKAK